MVVVFQGEKDGDEDGGKKKRKVRKQAVYKRRGEERLTN